MRVERFRPPAGVAGRSLIVWSWRGTAVFTAAAVAATILPDSLGPPYAALSLVFFLSGLITMLVAFSRAVGRSRSDLIGIGGLYFLAGAAPSSVRWSLLGSLAIEVVVAVTAASIRAFTPVAFGILVPVYALGLAGMWSASHGTFPARFESGE